MENLISVDDPSDTESASKAPSLEVARNRFVFNVVANAAYLGAQVLLTLWMTPYLIGYLGIAAYGIIPLTQNLVSYTSILTSALNSASTRYLAIDLGQHQTESANKTFNTALFTILGLFSILTPAMLGVAIAFPRILNIPAGREQDAGLLFICVALAFFSSVTGGIFSVSTFVYSEFVKLNLVNFLGLLARVSCIVLLFSLFSPRLWYAGAGALLAAVISLLGYGLLWRRLTPELRIAGSDFEVSRLKDQLGMSGWVAVNTAGAMLLSRVDLIIANVFYGAAVGGGYASITQFTLLMEYLVSAAGNVIQPVILLKYAQRDRQGLRVLCMRAGKMLGFALALPVGLLCGFSKPFLSLWLGPSFQNLSILMIAILIHQAVNYSIRPMLFVQTAYNKVRWPGVVTLLCGIASVALGILLATWNRWGVVGVAVAIGISWTVKNAVFMPIYTAHIMRVKLLSLIPSLLPSIIGTLLVGSISYWITVLRMPTNWLSLGAFSLVVSLAYAVIIWTIGLARDDRRLIISLFAFLPDAKRLIRLPR